MLGRLVSWFAHQRRVTALLVGAMSAAAVVGLVRLQFDDVPRTIFRSNDEDFARLEEAFDQFGADDSECVLLVEADDLYTPAGIVGLQRLTNSLREMPELAEVRSVCDLQVFAKRQVPRVFEPLSRTVPTQPIPLWPTANADGTPPSTAACEAARSKALAHPLAAGRLVSADGRAALVTARLHGDDLSIKQISPVVARMRTLADDLQRTSGLTIRLTGPAPIRAEIFESVQRESAKFVIVGGGLAFLMALLMFRRPAAVFIVCLPAMIGAAWTIGLMGLVGERMNIITTVVPTLIMVLGFTDAVHMMIDIRRERREGATPKQAAGAALRQLGWACVLCAATTAIGFGSLAVAQIEVVQRFGVVCAIGAMLTTAAVLTVVPLVASTRLGNHVHSKGEFDLPQRIARRFEPVVVWIVAHPRRVAATGIVLTAAMSASIFLLVPSNQATEALPSSSPAFAAVGELDRHFGGSAAAMILVDWQPQYTLNSPQVLEAIDAAQSLAAAQPHIGRPTSIVDLVNSLPGEGEPLVRRARRLHHVPESALQPFARTDLRRALIRLPLADIGSERQQPLFAQLRAGLAALEGSHPAVKYHLTGTSVLASRNLNQMINDLNGSLGSAAATIFLVMAIGFGSIRLGLISIVPNLFPMAATATFLVVTGRPLQMTSVIVFCICLGMAVDDTIHFINRFKSELRRAGDVPAAVIRTYRVVGSAMIMTSLVLVVGFAGLLTSAMPTTQQFSWLSCLTIGSAVIAELFLLPAMLVTFMPQLKQVDLNVVSDCEERLVAADLADDAGSESAVEVGASEDDAECDEMAIAGA